MRRAQQQALKSNGTTGSAASISTERQVAVRGSMKRKQWQKVNKQQEHKLKRKPGKKRRNTRCTGRENSNNNQYNNKTRLYHDAIMTTPKVASKRRHSDE